jgi:hypothetical protein
MFTAKLVTQSPIAQTVFVMTAVRPCGSRLMTLEFTTRPVNVREYLLLERITTDAPHNFESVVELAVSRLADPDKDDDILEMPMAEFNDAVTSMFAELRAAIALQQLAESWDGKANV